MDSSQKSPDQATQELEGGSTQVPNWQIITAFVFGALFLTAILVLLVLIPNPTPAQFLVFRIVISLAAAGIVGIFSGYLHIQGQVAQWTVRGGGALGVFVLVYFFSPTLVDTSAVHQECTGDNCEQNVTVNNNYGITQEDHEKALKKREQEVIDRLSKADPSDHLMRQVLEKEYNAVTAKLNNLEVSYQAELTSRAQAETALKEIKDKLPQSQADAALRKFQEGDKGAAKQLFDKVIEQAEKTNELAGKAAYENGQMAEQEIRYLEAREYYQKAMRFQPDNSTFTNALGSILHDLGQYDQAIQHYQLALANDLKTYGEDHPSVARDRNNLGSAYHSLGQYDKAIEYYQLALASNLKTYGEDHPNVAIRLNNLGSAYVSLGQYDKAIEYFQLALASGLKTYGEDHPNVAIRRNNLGSAYVSLGQYDKAIEYYQLALASGLKTYGEDHPYVAGGRNNLGEAYRALGQYDKAIEYFQLALASDLKTYGEDHPRVARDRNNLGFAYHSLGQYDKAIEYYQLALASDLKTYGEDHPQVATYRNNLGGAYKSLGQYDKAIEYFQLALKTFEAMLGKEHPNTKVVTENLRLAQEQLK